MTVSHKMKKQSFYSRFFTRRAGVFMMLVFATLLFFIYPVPQADAGWCMGTFTGDGCEEGTSYAEQGVAYIGEKASGWLKELALAILTLEGFIANAAAALFVTMLDPAAFKILMDNPLVYEMWKVVRDIVNMLFILILLFSAFATIYQIDKYKYNRIVLTVIIMALLVNFSWPISRVIVDFFSSMMYFIVQSIFQTSPSEVGSGLLAGANLKEIFLGDSNTWASIFLAIITLFIFMMTLLVLSVMMLIRLVALPLLVMVSPIGFAGMAAPFTHGYAMKWWNKLFTYASYGPITVFLVLVAVRFLQNAQGFEGKIKGTVSAMSAGPGGVISTETLVSFIYFALPIVLFWIAITQAEKMTSEIGPMTIAFGSKASKWLGRGIVRSPWSTLKWTGIPGGVKMAVGKRMPAFLKTTQSQRDARVASWLGVSGARATDITRRAASDEYKNLSSTELEQKALRGDIVAAHLIAKQGKMTDAIYAKITPQLDADESVADLLNNDVKKKRIDLIINRKMNDQKEINKVLADTSLGITDAEGAKKHIAKKSFQGLSNDQWKELNMSEVFKSANTDMIAAAKETFADYATHNPQRRNKIIEQISGSQEDDLRARGII